MALDKKFKKKWVEALRSGEFNQTKGVLYNGKNGFCCLGVAAHIGIKNEWETEDGRHFTVLDNELNLPAAFCNKIGLTTEEEDDLVRMNDSEKRTFKTIANYIEENL